LNRLTKDKINRLLSKRFEGDEFKSLTDLPKPHYFKDMQKATKRIVKAINEKEKITIVGDYDVDGVVSSVIISEFFDDLGVEYELIIPNRFRDGYGINAKLLDRIDASLIITVDNGISAVEAAKICKERGIDLIITDHHNIPQTLPEAYAIINPKQSDCDFGYEEICGAQVAWYLVASLKAELCPNSYDLGKFLDLLAVAIMADMMELKGLNRVMVKSGLRKLNSSKRVAFRAIKDFFSKSRFVSDDISFLLSPLINSAGRMEDASLAYDLLRAKSLDEAMVKLEYIVGLNNMRKEIELDLFEKAKATCNQDAKIIVVWGEDWHEGVIGIVAARLCRAFQRPAIVLGINDGIAKGSARSVGNVNILEMISTCKELILGFGGHKSAAGLAIESKNLQEFRDRLEELASNIADEDFIDTSDLLGEINANEIDLELVELLESYEPYGQKNPKPKFILKNAYVCEDRVLGMNKNHLKLSLMCEKKELQSIYFNFGKKASEGEHIDLICTISKNEFRGDVSVQLIVDKIV